MAKDRRKNRNKIINCNFNGCDAPIRSDNMDRHLRSHTGPPPARDQVTGRFIAPGEVPPGEVPPGEVPH